MAGTELYKGYAVRYRAGAMGAAALIGGITAQRVMSDPQEFQEVTAGVSYPWHVGHSAQKIGAEFTTLDVSTILANVPPPGLALLTTGLELYTAKYVDGTIASGSVHNKFAIGSGVLYPTRLSCQADKNAEITYRAAAAWDGSNNPCVVTAGSAALPSETLADGGRYGMRAASVSGVTLTGRTSLEIDFGITAEQLEADGDIWAKYVAVNQMVARITIKSVNLAHLAAAGIPFTGKAATHANTVIYLGQRENASYNAGNVHVKITAAGMAAATDMHNSQNHQRSECTLQILCGYDGTNCPVVVATSQALP